MIPEHTPENFRAKSERDLNAKINALYAIVLAIPGASTVTVDAVRTILDQHIIDTRHGTPLEMQIGRAMHFAEIALEMVPSLQEI